MLTNNDCFFIGGVEIYKQVLPITDIIYLTKIESFNPDDKNIKYERYKF